MIRPPDTNIPVRNSALYMSKLAPEELLLLRFSRLSPNSEEGSLSEIECKQILDAVKYVTTTKRPHSLITKILPLIYNNLHRSGLLENMAAKMASGLKNQIFLMIAQDLANQQHLQHICEILSQLQNGVILLKGVAFAKTIYPDSSPRLGCDIDLLVTEGDFEKACALMSEDYDPVVLDESRMATYDTLFERVFRSKANAGPTIEIHNGLTNPHIFKIDEATLWSNSVTHPYLKSEKIRILSPEDTLLHLAVHAFRDLDFCTHNVLDAHEVWCQWNPDSKALLERSKQWGAQKVLYYILVSCKTIMGTPVPDELLEKLQPNFATNAINEQILQSYTLTNPGRNMIRYRFIQLMSQFTFPDSLLQGAKFQYSYAQTRLSDLLRE